MCLKNFFSVFSLVSHAHSNVCWFFRVIRMFRYCCCWREEAFHWREAFKNFRSIIVKTVQRAIVFFFILQTLYFPTLSIIWMAIHVEKWYQTLIELCGSISCWYCFALCVNEMVVNKTCLICDADTAVAVQCTWVCGNANLLDIIPNANFQYLWLWHVKWPNWQWIIRMKVVLKIMPRKIQHVYALCCKSLMRDIFEFSAWTFQHKTERGLRFDMACFWTTAKAHKFTQANARSSIFLCDRLAAVGVTVCIWLMKVLFQLKRIKCI